jgi:hypothetical protein
MKFLTADSAPVVADADREGETCVPDDRRNNELTDALVAGELVEASRVSSGGDCSFGCTSLGP